MQMTNYYKDRTESAIYGSRLLIFKRIDLKSDSWWFRATIDGHKGYVRRSCKTSNKEIALNYATQKYEELRFKKSNNQSVAYASKSLKVSVNSCISFLNEPNLKNFK